MRAGNDKLSVFLTVFAALNIVFAFYVFSFFWGNHDWDWVKGTAQVLSLETGMFEGRYAKFILNVALFGGQVLPVLNTVVAFTLSAAGSTLLISYWQIERKPAKVVIALLPVLSPFVLGWLYFPINILGNFAAVVLVTGGLIWGEKSGIGYKIGAVICFLSALGIYPSVLEMMIVCFCFRHILNPDSGKGGLCRQAVLILTSLILFKLLLLFLTNAGFIYGGHYNMQTAAFADIVRRLPETAVLAVGQLRLPVPFVSLSYKLCALLLIVLSSGICLRRIEALLLWLIAFGATVASAALTAVPDEVAFMPRVNFYGLNFFYTGAAAVLLRQQKQWRNIGLLLSVLCLFLSVKQDLYAQKVWHFGKRAEEQLAERISLRIEQRGAYYPLIPVVAGELPLRPRYYQEVYAKPTPYVLNAPFLVRHIPAGMFNFYAPRDYFAKQAQISEPASALLNFLQYASRPWPAEAGIYVDDTYAVILLTSEGIGAIKAQLPK